MGTRREFLIGGAAMAAGGGWPSMALAGGSLVAVSPPLAGQASVPRGFLVLDASTGRIAAQGNPDVQVHPASLTKMMTLHILFTVLDAGKVTLDTPIPISASAAARPNTKLGLPEGATIRVEDAILALTVHSCNDIATAVAEFLAGTEDSFAGVMTSAAHAIGMSRTMFTSASGLPDPMNVSTPRELLLLGGTVMARHPGRWKYFGVPKWSYGGTTFANTNKMLSTYPGMDGGKSGYVRQSGFNLFASASRDSRRLLGVVVGQRTMASCCEEMAGRMDAVFAG